ncbi:MAG: hypothetical protein D3903_05105 [Candidatus Electrothrix sp. GM3_4]|nr:hypothetical protein [Candidatus Electrothrix sp. GM3_4]
MMRKIAVAGLMGIFFLLNTSAVLATEDLYTDAIQVLRRMEEKTVAIKMCGAGLLEKRKENKSIVEKIMETCACCSDAYYCCYTMDCKPCPEMNAPAEALTEVQAKSQTEVQAEVQEGAQGEIQGGEVREKSIEDNPAMR